MPFTIVRQDITKMNVDVIVNAANTDLAMGGGVCGAIFKAAGVERMKNACDGLSPIKTGGAVITAGFDLPSKYVIHTAGPIYGNWSRSKSKELLYSAYISSLTLAKKYNARSIAFPLISGGIYGYPKAEALRVAVDAIRDFLMTDEMDVYLAVFDNEAFASSCELMDNVKCYIDENYVKNNSVRRSELYEILGGGAVSFNSANTKISQIDDYISNLDVSFTGELLKLIDASGEKDSDIYKRANIDRKLFSKIRKGQGYLPKKRTAVSLALALRLNLHQTNELIGRLGYTLSHSQLFDVIIEYFIVNGIYDIWQINEVLFQYNLPLLGSGAKK